MTSVFRWTARLESLLRKWHAAGFHDTVIARRLGCCISCAMRRRHRLGLKANYRKNCIPVGERSPRSVGERLKCLVRLWPQVNLPSEADLLDVFDLAGVAAPADRWLTGAQVARGLGVQWLCGRLVQGGLGQRVRRLLDAGVLERRRCLDQHRRFEYRIASGIRDRFGRLAGTQRVEVELAI